MYWARHCGGRVVPLKRGSIEEGHCTSINFSGYQRLAHISQKYLGAELDLNFDLDQVIERLGLKGIADGESNA